LNPAEEIADRWRAKIEIEHPLNLEQGQIDHTVVDVMVVDERHRLPIGRPYITGRSTCVAAASRRDRTGRVRMVWATTKIMILVAAEAAPPTVGAVAPTGGVT
jgi:hypothetical protein